MLLLKDELAERGSEGILEAVTKIGSWGGQETGLESRLGTDREGLCVPCRDWTRVIVGREGGKTVSYKMECPQGEGLTGTHNLGEFARTLEPCRCRHGTSLALL